MKLKQVLATALGATSIAIGFGLPASAREGFLRAATPGGRVDLYTSYSARHLATCAGVDGQRVNAISTAEANGERWHLVVIDDCGLGYVRDRFVVFYD